MVLDGKKVSKALIENIKKEVESIGDKIKLVVILVGNDSASQIYVRFKQRACSRVGILCDLIKLDQNIDEKRLINIIDKVNNDNSVHGILVQLPLPKHLNTNKIINYINPNKDVDGLTIINQGRLFNNCRAIIPATPKGIISILDHYHINLEGKKALVIGRSNLVGKPLALLLLQKNATVTIAHSRTKNLNNLCQNYDIIISAVGKAHFITRDMIKKGAIVIDVGISRINGTVVGDCMYEEIKEVASYITPVPGGVGPMTIASLLENVIYCYKILKGYV